METQAQWHAGENKPADHQINQYIGARLRLRRKLLGYSQARLGQAIGLTFQQIQKYERGKSRIPAPRLWALGRAMRVPISYFFDGLAEAGPITEDPLTAAELQLCHALRRLPRQQRKTIHDLIMAFTDEPEAGDIPRPG